MSLLLFSTAIASVLAVDAQSASPQDESSPRRSTSPISPRLSEAIRAKLPEYAPAPESESTDAEIDPDVVILSPITVRDNRRVPAEEWELLSESGRAALLKERYKGATIPGARLTETIHNYGLQMHRDDVRVGRLAELDAAVDSYRETGFPDDWKDLKKELLKARMRPKDMRAESMDRSYNNGRR